VIVYIDTIITPNEDSECKKPPLRTKVADICRVNANLHKQYGRLRMGTGITGTCNLVTFMLPGLFRHDDLLGKQTLKNPEPVTSSP
jgi:hypothetical protein